MSVFLKQLVVLVWLTLLKVAKALVWIVTMPFVLWYSFFGFTLTLPKQEKGDDFGCLLTMAHFVVIVFTMILSMILFHGQTVGPHHALTPEFYSSNVKLYLLAYFASSMLIYLGYYGNKWSKDVPKRKNSEKPKREPEIGDQSSASIEDCDWLGPDGELMKNVL